MCNVCKICTKFTVQLYKKPVYNTSVHKTSLPYKCTQNLLPYKWNWSIKKGMYTDRQYLRNVQGWNITKSFFKSKLVLCTLLTSKLVLFTLVQLTGFMYSCTVNWFCVHFTLVYTSHSLSLVMFRLCTFLNVLSMYIPFIINHQTGFV